MKRALKLIVGAAALTLGIGLALPAAADPVECRTRIEGEPVTIIYDDDAPVYSSFRERHLTRSRTCPGAVVVAYLTPELTPDERQVFCANYDASAKSYSFPAQGRRDAYGRCVTPSNTCRFVNASKQEALALVGIGEGAAEGTLPDRISSTISAVTHSSGALVLSGTSGYVSSILGTLGSSLGTALAAPGAVAGAAISVVVIGGAVYVCSG